MTLLLLVAFPVLAQECSATDAQAVESSVDSLDSWGSIHAAYQRYSYCDDGAIAEGFTDRVVHLLATQWASLSQVRRLIAHDPEFQDFVLRHINASALTSELDRVAHLARHQCPRSATLLCNQIAEAASER
ncbi:hypothetical protein N800_13500 [Lysobacter daejeonensis GH1-9]|uniref:Uncharacterized protein n=1 Tax=Lysobacter daejeonensis GH1-9 TaxID=1385517 RepID=A0A0A0EN80_9GAMM|nr:hypothetical protein N800_13500 [Lysobacter daejeonensis GH1-9]